MDFISKTTAGGGNASCVNIAQAAVLHGMIQQMDGTSQKMSYLIQEMDVRASAMEQEKGEKAQLVEELNQVKGEKALLEDALVKVQGEKAQLGEELNQVKGEKAQLEGRLSGGEVKCTLCTQACLFFDHKSVQEKLDRILAAVTERNCSASQLAALCAEKSQLCGRVGELERKVAEDAETIRILKEEKSSCVGDPEIPSVCFGDLQQGL